MQLIIVESPTKAKTINRFLGKDYKVESSYGHIRAVPLSKIRSDNSGGNIFYFYRCSDRYYIY